MSCNGNNKILEVRNLKIFFYTDNGVVKAVDGISFDLMKGETLAIVGETGSGKSVTALSMLRLIKEPPGRIVEGEIIFDGKDLLKLKEKELEGYRGKRISMIFQDPMTSLNPVYTIGNQVTESLEIHRNLSKNEIRKETIKLLEMTGIPEAGKRLAGYPHEFSGGMRQRVMIAIAIANSPDILIADEPTTALDVTIQAQILELINDIKERSGSSVILITHDLGVVAKYADRVVVMYAGKAVELASVDDLFYNPLHPYTIGLMNSMTRPDKSRKDRLKPIAGSPPSAINLPEGCVFRKRCSYRRDYCGDSYPPLVEVADKHFSACYRAGEIQEGSTGINK